MSPDTISLLINAGVAGVFAVFAITIAKAFLEHMNAQMISWRSELDERDDKYTKSLDVIAQSLNSNTQAIISLTTLFARHDEAADRFMMANNSGKKANP